MQQNKIGLIGLAVMGANLAKNFASKGVSISVFNRTYSKTQAEVESWNNEKFNLIENAKKLSPWFENNLINHEYRLEGFESLQEFVQSLERPRKVIVMVKAGKPVDDVITELLNFLEPGDTIIDCGNSNWQETLKRQLGLEQKGYNYIGCGVSGGEKGALEGPSIMPGGKKNVVDEILPLLEVVSAPDFKNKPCVVNVGLAGSGHFVKMVHNGIEYAIMQGIAEIYDILRHLGLDAAHISKVFENLNTGSTDSFLTKISIDILKQKDNLGTGFLVDKIDSAAGSKGTGKWTVEAGMELGIAIPNIAAALFSRVLSSRTHNFATKVRANQINILELSIQDKLLQSLDLEIFHKALEAIYYTSYLQGLDLILEANKQYNWNIDLSQVLRIWQGGCIIRSKMLEDFSHSFNDGKFKDLTSNLEQANLNLINLYNFLAKQDFSLPLLAVFNSSLDYACSLTMDNLPTNLTQSQRDYFGSHTYKRNDRDGVFTGGWDD